MRHSSASTDACPQRTMPPVSAGRLWRESHTKVTLPCGTRHRFGGTLEPGGGWLAPHPWVGLWGLATAVWPRLFCLDWRGRNRAVPPVVMDLPVLDILARELAESERLGAFSDEVGRANARVSEPALPLLLAALHLRLERGLVCLLPEDAEARA